MASKEKNPSITPNSMWLKTKPKSTLPDVWMLDSHLQLFLVIYWLGVSSLLIEITLILSLVLVQLLVLKFTLSGRTNSVYLLLTDICHKVALKSAQLFNT